MIKLCGVKAELKQGILNRWKIFLLVVLGASFLTVLFCVDKNSLLVQGRLTGSITLADAFVYFFRGMKEYDPLQDKVFDVVDSYLIWNVILALIIGSYPARNMKGIGKQYILRSQTRGDWWLIKCIWNIGTVIAYYIGIWCGLFLGTFAGQIICGSEHIKVFSTQINTGLFKRVFYTEVTQSQQMVLLVLILPLVAALAISMLQMMVLFLVNTAVGYIVVIGVVILSAYWMKDELIGNAMMVFRYSCVNPSGIHWQETITVCCAIWGMSAVIGYMKFRNQDIY